MTANREGVASDTARPRSAAGVIVLAIVIAAIALGAAGYGASRWMESRVERQVEAAFASMRTTLGVATYGHQEFHPLSRSMAIDDVVLQPRNGATPAIKIRQLVLSGLPIFPTDSFAAGHIELADVAIDSGAGRGAHMAHVAMEDVTATPFGPEAEQLRALVAVPMRAGIVVPARPEIFAAIAAMSEHVRIAKADLREFTSSEGASSVAIAAVHLDDFRSGKLARLTVEGMRTANVPQSVTLDRMVLNGLDYAGMLRLLGQFGPAGAQPDPHQALALMRFLEGFEVNDLVGPDERPGQDPGQMFHISAFKGSWGRFAGPTPTTVRFSMTAAVPIGANETGLSRSLRDAGRTSITFMIDLGLAWNDATRTFTVDPVVVSVDQLFSTSLVASVDNFPLDILLINPVQFSLAAGNMEAGPLTLTIRDSGMLDLAVADAAKKQGVSTETARRTMLDNLNMSARAASQQNPDILRLAEAVTRFMATSNGSLRIALTPKGHVNVMQTLQLAGINPAAALARFTLEAGPDH